MFSILKASLKDTWRVVLSGLKDDDWHHSEKDRWGFKNFGKSLKCSLFPQTGISFSLVNPA